MELKLNATKPPLLKLSSSGANFTVFGDVLVNVLKPGNSSDSELAFVLGAVVLAEAEFYLKNNSANLFVCGNTTFIRINLSLVSTNIGDFDVDVLQEAANLLSILYIIPLINNYANSGVPFPVIDDMTLTNASLKLGEDYVLVAADIVYS
ncbi:Bactericidal permeability-increasing protein [Geodia barretti]|nr:Bactericidal permeability-increasing protein [Geodia barretti]